MSTEQIYDQMVLFFERQGIYLTPRQVDFCRLFLKYQDATKAARLAGYPDPKDCGENLYIMYREYISAWQSELDRDKDLVMTNYRRMAQATVRVITNREEMMINKEAEAIYEDVPDDKTRAIGCKGIRDVLGLDKTKEVDLNLRGRVELPASTREKMDKVYVQVAPQQQDPS